MFQTQTKLAGHLASWYVPASMNLQPSLSAKTSEDIRPAMGRVLE